MVDEKLKILTIILIIFLMGFITRLETVELRGLNNTEKAYYTDEKGLPYMYGPDSYYNYRLAANILDHGHPGDKIINGTPWDLHSYYPPGGPVDYPPLILWLSIIFYKLLNLFTTIDLMEACFWLPAIIGPLAGIPTFFFVRRYASNLPGLLAGIILVLAPFYFVRTVPGFYDTDMFNIFFPVLVAFFFCKAVESEDYIYSFLSSLSLAMFSLAWNGWPYIFYIIILSGVFYILFLKVKGRRIMSFFKKLMMFIIISMALILLFGRLHYISIFQIFFNFVFKSQHMAWPSLYESVEELKVPTFNEFLSAAGPLNIGLGFFAAVILTTIMLRNKIRKTHLPKLTLYPFILMLTWLIIDSIAYSLSLRFALLAIPPIAIFTGLLIETMDSYLGHSLSKQLKRSRSVFILIFIILLSIISILQASKAQLEPCIDDDFVLACSWIKNETPQSTIIISGWGHGSPISTISDRPVLIDNTRQGNLRSYWLYHAFATSNESLSAGIFIMLSTSGNKAIELLEGKTGNASLTVAILDDILGVDKKRAGRILEEKYHMDPPFIRELLTYTHPSEKKPFIIVTRDKMILTGQWYPYYGSWDFNKSKGYDHTYSIGSSNDTNQVRYYSNNVKLDLNNGGSWENKKAYNTIIVAKNSTRIITGDKKSNFSIIALLDKNWAIIIDKNFQDSLFVKLVILKEETEHFKPIYRNNSTIIWAVKE
ncbi:MAG TPA: hypothetical protein HA298_00120 [Methanobacteriales archaeon]|nr:MAG: Oligosaccharyl transferase STT3 subunit related protein [Methanobacteriaceae archaeon 41_258]MBC7096209.1 hypothetical protein [Methanobacteriales archaeon]HIH61086.1 hypothetical protein [Methanobacteriales archaeon]